MPHDPAHPRALLAACAAALLVQALPARAPCRPAQAPAASAVQGAGCVPRLRA